MFIEVSGLMLPKLLRVHEFAAEEPKKGWGWKKPDHVVPLGEARWPEDVVNHIVTVFMAIGVKDPLRQKLVEPFAYIFGGKWDEGAQDLKNVDWTKVKEYFTWEAKAISRQVDEAVALNRECSKKYGFAWSHYTTYENLSPRA